MYPDNGNGNGVASLKGRVALVTGAARGIGRAISLGLASRGAAVAINYRTSQAEAETLAEQIKDIGVDCWLVPGDIGKSDQARAVVQQVLDQAKRIDILVNNAGVTKDRSLRKMADEDWVDVINVNLNGTYYCTSAALRYMIDHNFGRIVNITSMVGQTGNFGQANYAASKGGVVAFTKTVALEMAKYNITANSVSPGFTCTEMMAKIPPNILDQIRAKIPLGRFAMPDEIARTVTFLVADGDYITGQQLGVNGGLYM